MPTGPDRCFATMTSAVPRSGRRSGRLLAAGQPLVDTTCIDLKGIRKWQRISPFDSKDFPVEEIWQTFSRQLAHGMGADCGAGIFWWVFHGRADFDIGGLPWIREKIFASVVVVFLCCSFIIYLFIFVRKNILWKRKLFFEAQ